MDPDLIECIHRAGNLLLSHFGRVEGIRIKDSRSSIITDADLASDRLIREFLAARYPGDNVLTEESGFVNRGSSRTWVVDPLDGTSNFAAGIPWFGVMIALLEGIMPIQALLLIPAEKALYTATQDSGATRNGQTVRLSPAPDLASTLCAYGMDSGADVASIQRQTDTLSRIVREVRNVRATNSLVDFTMTLDGKFGTCVNFHTMLWDIVAPWLLFREAGGLMTDHAGRALTFSLGPDACERSYAVAAGPADLHRALVPLLSD